MLFFTPLVAPTFCLIWIGLAPARPLPQARQGSSVYLVAPSNKKSISSGAAAPSPSLRSSARRPSSSWPPPSPCYAPTNFKVLRRKRSSPPIAFVGTVTGAGIAPACMGLAYSSLELSSDDGVHSNACVSRTWNNCFLSATTSSRVMLSPLHRLSDVLN